MTLHKYIEAWITFDVDEKKIHHQRRNEKFFRESSKQKAL